jgi:quinol monooxygenase YgiN
MSQDVMEDLETIEGMDWDSGPGNPEAALETEVHTRFRKMNARSVEFVAKPDKIEELRDCFRGPITDFLETRRGFSGAVVLTSHKEPRLILVISLWKAERDATDNCWEKMRVVRRLVGPLADVCSRVHTYEALLPQPTETEIQVMDLQVC